MPRPLKDNLHPEAIVSRRLDFWDPYPEEMYNSELNPYVKEYFEHGSPVVVGRDAKQYKGKWDACFGRTAPLCLEIGSGNGFFLEGMAQKNPDHNWLGIEIRYKRVIMVAKKLEEAGVENGRILRYDNWCLDDLFEEGSLAGVYCNHPDPWTKKRQAHKRIWRSLCHWMAWAMADGLSGASKPILKRTLTRCWVSLKICHIQCLESHATHIGMVFHGNPPEDITTNYERKFIERNLPIYALRLQRNVRS